MLEISTGPANKSLIHEPDSLIIKSNYKPRFSYKMQTQYNIMIIHLITTIALTLIYLTVQQHSLRVDPGSDICLYKYSDRPLCQISSG